MALDPTFRGAHVGYAEGVAAGLAWGQAHGAAKTLRALLARAPTLAAHTREVIYISSSALSLEVHSCVVLARWPITVRMCECTNARAVFLRVLRCSGETIS